MVYLVNRGDTYPNGKPRYSVFDRNIDTTYVEWGGKVFKPYKVKYDRGYQCFYITLPDGSRRRVLVHVAVNALYNNASLNEPTHHKDGNKLNNEYSNLISLSREVHAKRHTEQGDYSILEPKILDIVVYYEGIRYEFKTVKQWAEQFNLNLSCCYKVLNGERRVHKGWTLQP